MAAVVSFYQLPDEENVFLDYVEKSGKVIAIPDMRLRSRDELKPMSPHEVIETFNPDRMLLGLEEHANLITLIPRTGEDGEYFSVDPMDSPLISYTRPIWFAPKELEKSNLVAYWSYPNESATMLLDHPREFVKWAKKVLQKARAIAPPWSENKHIRLTPQVETAIREGVTLML